MATVAEHYSRVLADVYSWMYGGWDAQLARYTEFFTARGFAPRASKRAIDLGAGCGFQAIPLARLGFEVKAIDLDPKLLAELEAHVDDEKIETVCADLMEFRRHAPQSAELIVCMVDTLLHLDAQTVGHLELERAGEVQRLDVEHPGEGDLIVAPIAADQDGDLILAGAFERPVVGRCDALDHFKRVGARLLVEIDEGHAVSTLPPGMECAHNSARTPRLA